MTVLKIAQPEGMWLDAGCELEVNKEQVRRRQGMLKVLKGSGDEVHHVKALERVFFKVGESIGYSGPITAYIRKQCDVPEPKAAVKAEQKLEKKQASGKKGN